MPCLTTPDGISADQAEVLRRANYRNLVRKVHAGRSLSAGEVNLLRGIQAGGRPEARTFASTQAELAELLGVSRRTVQWAMKVSGSPLARADGRHDVAAWRALFQATGALDDDSPSATELKARHLLLQTCQASGS